MRKVWDYCKKRIRSSAISIKGRGEINYYAFMPVSLVLHDALSPVKNTSSACWRELFSGLFTEKLGVSV
jgi:hypothetical protein